MGEQMQVASKTGLFARIAAWWRRYMAWSAQYRFEQQFGPVNPKLHCPHCQTTGQVRARRVDRKKGISGGKAAGAILTGGVSMLATGLSRKEDVTQARCGNCSSQWDF